MIIPYIYRILKSLKIDKKLLLYIMNQIIENPFRIIYYSTFKNKNPLMLVENLKNKLTLQQIENLYEFIKHGSLQTDFVRATSIFELLLKQYNVKYNDEDITYLNKQVQPIYYGVYFTVRLRNQNINYNEFNHKWLTTLFYYTFLKNIKA